MILRTAYVRFFRAFNFDYLRKSYPEARRFTWDIIEDDSFYPYVTLDVDRELTAVLGANESGKSQLLQAIECALGKATTTPADFCRYSTHFTVAETMKVPHFGLHFVDVTEEEARRLSQAIPSIDATDLTSFRVFRTDTDELKVYTDEQSHDVGDPAELEAILPKVFRIDPGRAIPNSVPISFLIPEIRDQADPGLSRTDRWALVDPLVAHAPDLVPHLRDPQAFATALAGTTADIDLPSGLSSREASDYRNELDLAFDLLVTVGGIHASAFSELQAALRNEDEGLANGIVATMNRQLEQSLNLAKWWSQDEQFRLAIAVRDFDIVFTIRDRTGSEYSFAERSGGLKYFLSYLVQFLAHLEERTTSEILLMDEPDAYLSNQGQQDLLRLLHEFIRPTETAPGGQVLYVTHSPFLIDKNRADRIRVLDKGSADEGVRVVRDVARNHFEPLRTALGSFVGETTFIGNCNLMLEGLADQIYLAGMSDLLSRTDVPSTQRLDLNRITLVPAGSASHIPYLTFLARGRDADKPAVIVLLDGDEDGDRAASELERGGPRRKQLIRPGYIAQLKPNRITGVTSDRAEGPLDIEDLIPVEIGLAAAKAYLQEMEIEEPAEFPSAESVCSALSDSIGVLKAIQDRLDEAGVDLHLAKVAFARHALEAFSQTDSDSKTTMRDRFTALFSRLTAMQREAERERERDSITARVEREKALFLREHASTARKVDVFLLLERMRAVVDASMEGDALLTAIRRIEDDYDLARDSNEFILDFDALKARLEALKYAELRASQPDTPG